MPFFGTHNVTAEDIARAMRLARRPVEVWFNAALAIVLAGILIQVLYSFFIYLRAASGAGEKLLGLLLMQDGAINGIVAWLSIATTGTLPVFLFYVLRTLAETIWPGLRVTRLSEASDLIG